MNLTDKRILLISHELSYTGAPCSLLTIAQTLLKNNASVEVFSLSDGPFRVEFENLGIKVSIKTSKDYQKISEKFNLMKFDFAICNTIVSSPAYRYVKNYIPTVWYIHEATNIAEFFSALYAKELIQTSKDVYTVSEYAKNYIMNTFNIPVEVLHNCVYDFNDKNEKIFNKDKLNILALGTLEFRKRFDLIIDAINKLKEEYRNKVEFNFAGQVIASQKEYGENLISVANNSQNINYLGVITDFDKIYELYEKADIVIVPSMDESCSRVVIESFLMGVPVIISENVGAKYLVDDSNGWIVKTGESEPITQILSEILEGKYSLEEMSKSARNRYLETSCPEIFDKNVIKMVENKLKTSSKNYTLFKIIRNFVFDLFFDATIFAKNLKLFIHVQFG